jgi:hypothetical protein
MRFEIFMALKIQVVAVRVTTLCTLVFTLLTVFRVKVLKECKRH